ncbi:MAG: hypothetical protein ACK4YL_11510 [Microcystis sp.]|nr:MULTISPECIES: hypothetical protein [Microcystis]MCE2662533.1 hypothetical protein [Microcystis sp. 53602_E8]MCZ8055030.1 hypothetical protein [Microcystis sp. LE19-12.2C]MCZ8362121.1 hypothetical protein [Microcystis sp. LE19-251.1A]MDJ0544235.1 hypothetical protein [Microcystis sp. M53601_WE4]MDJ0547578.1 hypothetical protein [Microcystis sp. M49637_WE12]MDJ0567016.1 hypothetical protein [Microcystis sp. M49629_WE12]
MGAVVALGAGFKRRRA